MSRKKQNSRGFGTVQLLIVCLIIVVVAAIGWFVVYQRSHGVKTIATNAPPPSWQPELNVAETTFKTYGNALLGAQREFPLNPQLWPQRALASVQFNLDSPLYTQLLNQFGQNSSTSLTQPNSQDPITCGQGATAATSKLSVVFKSQSTTTVVAQINTPNVVSKTNQTTYLPGPFYSIDKKTMKVIAINCSLVRNY